MHDEIPTHIRTWLDTALPRMQADDRLLGVAAGGSWLRGELDRWSDLDLVVVVAAHAHDALMATRPALAASWGSLLNVFTGEHVGEPRLVICLYDAPLVHVDLKFVTPEELAVRVEDPAILWERDGAIGAALTGSSPAWPGPDPQRLEDRFWTWVHYAACKIGRGELFESIAGVGYLRAHVLAPLAMAAAGHNPQATRHIERRLPAWGRSLQATLCGYDARECAAALAACVECYRELRSGVSEQTAAEQAATAFLAQVTKGLPST